jgi:hypothetical protein
MVFDNRVLRRIFGPLGLGNRGVKKTVQWGGSYPVILNKYFRAFKSRRSWAVHVARRGERRGECQNLVEKPEERRHLASPRPSKQDNIKIDLQ